MRLIPAFLILALAPVAPASPAQERVPTEWVRTGRLGAAGIEESSGIAVSRRHPGVLWTHNDSGDEPKLYAVDQSGRLLATYHVQGADAVDWEDMTLGPCPDAAAGQRTCLYIGDVGDNPEERPSVVIYILHEPDPHRGGRTVSARALHVRYADGPHDVEALAIDRSGDLSLITKGRSGPILRYVIPRAAVLRDSVTVAPADTIPITPNPRIGRWVTGGSITPDGTRAVLRTHTELYFFTITDLGWARDGDPCWLGAREPQGEAVDFLDDNTLILTSEKSWAPEGSIHRVRCA